MARPREFDVDTALAAAMQVFWKNGYDGTALPDLMAGMNLSRGSVYKAFNDKKTLFLLALDRYEQTAVDGAVAHLTSATDGNGWQRIIELFETIPQSVAAGDRRGCLLCSAAAGPASYDNDIAAHVHRALGKLQRAFNTALRDGDTGDQALAALLVTHYVGLRVQSRARVPNATLKDSVTAIGQLRQGYIAVKPSELT